ncbi:hypothetical protein BD324DRAFT_332120 [Kockovaella imperatae]|uniref:Uncharacterized protein n=1 Tax=Kockovaella imperatae TaxID=4999 RepID=A0A1Y1UMZ9_9TREE|nr:hypothetical protein BD324DRAFT_332120 [Kockovaella imperatae]ORX39431.1 hypothetical protein BD324DRAFT_332120 [Kockovaella imperatae]
MSTPTTPLTSTFYSPHHTGPMQTHKPPSLALFLSTPHLDALDVQDGLVEHCFRSFISGKRVREWCLDIKRAARKFTDSTTLHHILYAAPLSILIPFPPDTFLAHDPIGPPDPESLLPPSTLSTLSRKQLVDALIKLSKTLLAERPTGWSELVLELYLEYIARRWRLALEKHDSNLVDGIGRKLLEIEFDVQLRGETETTRSLILPVLQHVRSGLGFITSVQLVSRLNSPRYQDAPSDLVSSWITIRLRAGSQAQDIIAELASAQDKIMDASHRSELVRTVETLGLNIHSDSQDTPRSTFESLTRRPHRKFSLRTRTLGFGASGKWRPGHQRLTSFKNSSGFPSKFDPERRPSLPNFSTTSLLNPFAYKSRLSTGGPESPSSKQASRSLTRLVPFPLVNTLSSPDLLGSTLDFIDPATIRPVLVHQLLTSKYHLSTDKTDDWYLGDGRHLAQRMLMDIENKLRINQGSIDAVSDLRTIFRLDPNSDRTGPLEAIVNGEFGTFPLPPPRMSIASTLMPEGHSRAASFDLDRYFEGLSESGPEDPVPVPESAKDGDGCARHSTETVLPPLHSHRRVSTGLESLLTMATGKTGLTDFTSRTRERRASHASFTIQKARRGWTGFSVKLVKPRRASSIDTFTGGGTVKSPRGFMLLEDPDDDTSDDESVYEDDESYIGPLESYLAPSRFNRWSKSEADLIFPPLPTDHDRAHPFAATSHHVHDNDMYTHLPATTSLRRKRRIDRPCVTAFDLGLGKQILTPPGFPKGDQWQDNFPTTPSIEQSAPDFSESSSTQVVDSTPRFVVTADAQDLMPQGYKAPLTPPISPPHRPISLNHSTAGSHDTSFSVVDHGSGATVESGRPLAVDLSLTESDTPRAKHQHRHYRILNGDLTPERWSDGSRGPYQSPVSPVMTPTASAKSLRQVSSSQHLALTPDYSPTFTEDWHTAHGTPVNQKQVLGGDETIYASPTKAATHFPVPVDLRRHRRPPPVPPPRMSSLRKVRQSPSLASLSGKTVWSKDTFSIRSRSITPTERRRTPAAPLSIESHTSSSLSQLVFAISDDGHGNFSFPGSKNALQAFLTLFNDASDCLILKKGVTEDHIQQMLAHLFKPDLTPDEQRHITWLIEKADELIDDPRWTRQAATYLPSVRSSTHVDHDKPLPSTPSSITFFTQLPDLTPRSAMRPPATHPLLSPHRVHEDLPWSASSPHHIRLAGRQSLEVDPSDYFSARGHPDCRASINTFGRRRESTGSSLPSPTWVSAHVAAHF